MALTFKSSIKTITKIDQLKILIRISAVIKGVKLSETEILILVSFIINGFNKDTKEKIIKDKLCKDLQNLNNIVSSLRRKGFFEKNGFKETLCKELNIKVDEDLIVFMLKLDNR